MTDKTTISHELILAPSRSLARKKIGMIKRGLELAGEIVRVLSAKEYLERGRDKFCGGWMGHGRDLDGAIDDFSKVIEIDPTYAKAYDRRGWAKIDLGDYLGAIEDYTKVIKLSPKDKFGYQQRARAKVKLGDYLGGIEDYTKVIEFYPKDSNGYWGRGWAKFHLNDYHGGIEDYTKKIELDLENFYARIREWSATLKLGDSQLEIRDFITAIDDLDPEDRFFFYARRGRAKLELGDYLGVIEDYNMAHSVARKYRLGDYYYKIGNLRRDLSIILRVMSIAYEARGEAKSRFGDYYGAIEDYTKAIGYFPYSGVCYYRRGMAKSKLGDRFGAEEDIMAAKSSPFSFDPSSNIGL